MEKKTLYRYIFLTVCIVILSVALPHLISFVSGRIVSHISSGTDTETETDREQESELPVGTTTIGDPSQYVEDLGYTGPVSMTQEEMEQAAKYETLVEEYQSYLGGFTKEVTAADTMKKGSMEKFIKHNPDQFYEAAATFAYSEWGTDRVIKSIRFDSITSYTDDNGDKVEQAMVEFLHTSHPETEEGMQVICIYYVNQGYYYFP
ncbi:MAG: hypothetical protein Q4B26_04185 [Eubacteriales bacterium]|nr:hypothetical protein [Eubacteriales bacterium]